ncbi:MAG: ribonuclease HIII [Ignavibacteriaceae bacterium]|nr:ribonuclease HIII [Ignavibacteriaceae bacterium]
MNSVEKSAQNIIDRYSRQLESLGFTISVPQKEQYSYNVTLKKESESVKLLVYFGKKGNKLQVQGNPETAAFQEVNTIIFGEKLFKEDDKEIKEPDNYIGTDESGKGDFFGPLVVAGVLVDKVLIFKLIELGVRDSKTISDYNIKILASKIKSLLKNKYDIIPLKPEKYNELYKKMGNVNLILGWGHAKVIENILASFEVEEAISDKFGNEKTILNALQQKGRKIKLHQVTNAERYTAVAAASILARDAVIKWFEINSKKLKIKIPKGASKTVENSARKVVKTFGKDALPGLVKMHFKTSKRI